MDWVVLSLISALFLGFYDLSNKHALRDNAVLPVIFFATLSSAFIWSVLIVIQRAAPHSLPRMFVVDPLTPHQHLLLFTKSVIVGASWIFNYFGIKHLPLSLASPIRATGPLWTLAGAVIVLQERPNAAQCIGIGTTLLSFLALSLAGRQEGVHFHRDKWVGFMVVGTVLGALSSLYDKFLLGSMKFPASAVQAWFSIYLVVVFFPLAIGWQRRWWPRNVFYWRWSIPCIGLVLLVSDYAYFTALSDAEGLVSVVAGIRRGSTLVAFAGGLYFFNETNGLKKLPAVLGVMAGIILTIVGPRLHLFSP
ncbi:MAG TPA: DMT family transporter [Opitutaceae bacterium]|nr:DMT family transporter [Opitutaceae bacterium]